jgi:hypothetical protein
VVGRTSGTNLVSTHSLAFTFRCIFYVFYVLELSTKSFIFTSILAYNLFIVAILVARIACARL